MVKKGTDFVVFDAKTGEEITRSVLTQIIFEEESKGQNLLPINFLRQLIRFYGDSMQAFVPGFLEFSLESLTREQDKFRQQMMESWGADPFKAIEDHAKRNMAMFSDAMRMFNPFAAMASAKPPEFPTANPANSRTICRPSKSSFPPCSAASIRWREISRRPIFGLAALQGALDRQGLLGGHGC